MPKITHSNIPLVILIGLAALSVPRVILHDLRLAPFDSTIYTLLAVGPFIIWVLVALLWKTEKPLRDFILLGIAFGLLLALTHQITWDASWGNNPPHLHGNLEGKLDPVLESLLLRGATFISSALTGLVAGVALALVALISAKVRPRLKALQP